MSDPFVGRYSHTLDTKGRVAVPASIRSAVWRKENPGIFLFFDIDPDVRFVHGAGAENFQQISTRFMVPFPGRPKSPNVPDSGEARTPLANPFARRNQILGRGQWSMAEFLAFDKEGRVVLPAPVVRKCQLSKIVSFVGCGSTFQIWDPACLAREDEKDARMLAQYRTMMEGFDEWQVETVAMAPAVADEDPG